MTIAIKATERSEALSNPFKLPRGEKLRREVRAVFEEQHQAILHYLGTGEKDFVPDVARGLRRLLQRMSQKDQAADLPFHWPAWHDFGLGAIEISKRMTPILTATWDQAADKFAPRVGLDPDEWSVVNPHTERMIQEAALAFCDSMNNTTSLQLEDALQKTRDTLIEGIVKKGETLPQLTKRINAIFDQAEKHRARAIAQTETSRAVHSAQEQAAIESGVVTGWQWLASGDACQKICVPIAMRARAIRLGGTFAVIGNHASYSQIKFPPAHVHCNCTMLEVLDTDPQPHFHDTLHQPVAATDEEADRFGREANARMEEILGSKPKPAKPKPAPKPPPTPPRKPPDPIPAMKLPAFATRAVDAAKAVPMEERYTDIKVWISDAFEEFRLAHPGATMAKFKARLGEANNKLLLTLNRADLPGALSPADLVKDAASETTWGNATFHFIRLPRE